MNSAKLFVFWIKKLEIAFRCIYLHGEQNLHFKYLQNSYVWNLYFGCHNLFCSWQTPIWEHLKCNFFSCLFIIFEDTSSRRSIFGFTDGIKNATLYVHISSRSGHPVVEKVLILNSSKFKSKMWCQINKFYFGWGEGLQNHFKGAWPTLHKVLNW